MLTELLIVNLKGFTIYFVLWQQFLVLDRIRLNPSNHVNAGLSDGIRLKLFRHQWRFLHILNCH